MLHTWLLILRLGDTKYAWYKGCHLISVMSLPDQDLCSIDQTIACLRLPALAWDAAAWNMDGGQEAIFYCGCSLTSPHFVHVSCCLWLVQIDPAEKPTTGFFLCLFICLFVILNWVPQIVAHKRETMQEADQKNTGEHGSPSIIRSGDDGSQIMSVCDEHFVKGILPLVFLFM